MPASKSNPNHLKLSELRKSKYLWYYGDCFDLVDQIPDQSVQLILTSPPYSINKEYERKSSLADTLAVQEELIEDCYRMLAPNGSICWQVGNYVEGVGGEKIPLDILLYKCFRRLGLKLRNRIIWHYEHGLHARHFFSCRYETVLWFTKSDDYYFNLDEVRVPQKQPTKRFYKGPKKGQLSCNPLGKNPGDVWKITNVKNGHPEKIQDGHPCQYPLELVERLVLALSRPGDIVFDPFGGVASTLVGAVANKRIAIGAEVDKEYHKLGRQRLDKLRQQDSKQPTRSRVNRSPSSDSTL